MVPRRSLAGRARWRLQLESSAFRARFARADLAVFHAFSDGPAGGANQSLRALLRECGARGVSVQRNVLSSKTDACLFNSFNFDAEGLRLFVKKGSRARMVHRVGAMTSLYRGYDDGTDAWVASVNREFAQATIAISQATIDMYRRVGVELVDPCVIHNPCDPAIFNTDGRIPFSRSRRIRIVAVSWSPNPKKGGPTYRWLEDRIDWERFELTFVGNSSTPFERLRHVPPLLPRELAKLLRQQDIFLTATENDAYSNALVEALSCGLPAVYLDSGGSAEAVRGAGFGFRDRDEIPALIDRLVDEYEERQAQIALPMISDIVDSYLGVLGLDRFVPD